MAINRIPIDMMSASALADYVSANMGLEIKPQTNVAGIKAKMAQAGFPTDFIEIDDGKDERPIARIEPKRERHTIGKRMVQLRIEQQEKPGGSEPVFLSVNGINILIPRATTCWVDYKYYHALQNAVAHIAITDEDSKITGYRKVPEYPVSVFVVEPKLTAAEKKLAEELEAQAAAERQRLADEGVEEDEEGGVTFLELCQMTARQTGTIDGTLPTTVDGQTNRLKQIVEFVSEAYIDIQNAHRMWRWLQSEFVGPIYPGVTRYAGTSFTDEGAETAITRFSQWGVKGDGGDIGLSMYPAADILPFTSGHGDFPVGGMIVGNSSGATATIDQTIIASGYLAAVDGATGYFMLSDLTGSFSAGEYVFWEDVGVNSAIAGTFTAGGTVADEGSLRWMDWDRFYETQLRGTRTPGRPQVYSITNDNRLVISPTPDAVYMLRGKYRKSPQVLAVDADTPEMPTDFHTIIKDAALCYVEGFDEGPRIPVYRLRMLPNWSMLEGHQLPQVSWGAPLA